MVVILWDFLEGNEEDQGETHATFELGKPELEQE
jgi:hypothetical protein